MSESQRQTNSRKGLQAADISSPPLYCEAQLDLVDLRMLWGLLYHAVHSNSLQAVTRRNHLVYTGVSVVLSRSCYLPLSGEEYLNGSEVTAVSLPIQRQRGQGSERLEGNWGTQKVEVSCARLAAKLPRPLNSYCFPFRCHSWSCRNVIGVPLLATSLLPRLQTAGVRAQRGNFMLADAVIANGPQGSEGTLFML